MPTPCDIGKDKTQAFNDNVQARNQQHHNIVSTIFMQPFKFLNWIGKKLPDDISEAQLQQEIAKEFGEEADVYRYAVPIMAMIQGSEMALHEAKNFLYGYSADLSEVYESRLLGQDKDGNKVDPIDIFAQPLPILKVLYQKLRVIAWESLTEEQFNEQKAILKKAGISERDVNVDLTKLNKDKSLADSGVHLGHGILGKLRVQFLIPRKLAYREKTGAIWRMQNHMNVYGPTIQRKVNRFMSPTKDRPFGIETIYKKLIGLNEYLIEKTPLSKRNLHRLFGNILRRRVIYVANKEQAKSEGIKNWTKPEFYYFTTKAPRRKKDGTYETYDDGIPKMIYQKPVKLSEYTVPNGTKGLWDVNLNKEGLKILMGVGLKKGPQEGSVPNIFPEKGNAYTEGGAKFIPLVSQYRQIDKEVYLAAKAEMKGSVVELLTNLTTTYGLDKDQLVEIFTNPDSDESIEILKIIDSNPKLKETHEFLMKVFDGNFNLGRLEGVDYQFEEQEHHFPGVYSDERRREQWQKMINGKEEKLDNMIVELDKLENKKLRSVAEDTSLKRLKDAIKEMRKEIKSHDIVLDLMDNMHEDKYTDTVITPFRENKYAKRATNAFDDAASRFDAQAYQDYLRHIFGAIERNYLTATMLKAFNDAESHEVREIVANLYKLPFNRVDIQSGILGWDYGPTSLSNFFQRFGIELSPEDVNHNIRIMNNWLTAAFLNRPTSAITNMSAMTQNIIDHGFQKTEEGWASWKKNREEWNALIKSSGLIDFTDYYSTALVEEATNTKIEQRLSEEILVLQWRYWERVSKKNVSDEEIMDAVTELEDTVTAVLEESTLLGIYIDKIENLVPSEEGRLTPKRLAERKKAFKRKKILMIVNSLSNWAITKEFTMSETIKKGPRDKANQQFWSDFRNSLVTSGVGSRAGDIVKIWGTKLQEMQLTMATSEQFVRSLSFVIGIQQAIRKGQLPTEGLPWEGWTDEEVDKAIEIGKTYSEWSNFQLSRGGMGQAGHAGLGLGIFKFKIWGHQKWSRDWDIIVNPYLSMKDDFLIADDTFDFKAIGRLMKEVFDPKAAVRTTTLKRSGKQDISRASNPMVAHLRAYIGSQFWWTALFDLMVLGPAGVAVGKFVPGLNTMFGRTLGSGSSDLASFIFLPFLLAINILSGAMDEEEAEKTWFFYFRRTAFGFIPNWGMDLIFGFVGTAADREKHRANVFSPLLPGPQFQWARENIASSLDFFDEEEDDY